MDVTSLLTLLANFASANPKLVGVCAVLYVVGLVAKIVREAVEKFVAESPSKEDDKKLEEIKASPAFKAVEFVLDLFLRLKKPQS